MNISEKCALQGLFNGRFIDLNTFEMPKINYVLENYSHFQIFDDKKSYFAYMGEIDSLILDIQQSSVIDETSLKLRTLQNFAMQYTKEQIYKELSILASKKSSSQDEILKFIGEPTRFEFLTAIALKQHFTTLEVLPNYSIDDEGLPKCHASGNQADIICKDSQSQFIVEVSLICGRGQVHSELLPITRHLKSLIEPNKDSLKLSYFAIFIAPKIFEDSKRYVKFIQFDEGLGIRNFGILEFIERLKITSMKSNSANEAFNFVI